MRVCKGLILGVLISSGSMLCAAQASQRIDASATEAASATATPADSQPKADTVLTHEHVWLARRLAPPLVSPDGSRILVSVSDPTYDPAQTVHDLWLLSSDGRQPARRLTATKAAETGAVFSPDGQRIAFSSQRDGEAVPQIYELDLAAGGEALPVTRMQSGARNPQYSPDGRSILFVSAVWAQSRTLKEHAQIEAERKARPYNARVYTGFPVRNWDRWLDDRQQRLYVQSLEGGDALDLLGASTLVQQAGFGGRQSETGEELDACWAPDGRSVIFAATLNRHRAAHSVTHADLYQVDLAGGEPRRLTPGDGLQPADSYSRPRFSANGQHLYALVQPRSDKVYNATRVDRFSWPEARRVMRHGLPEGRSINSVVLGPDQRTFYALAEDAGQEVLWKGRLDVAEWALWARPPAGVYANLAVNAHGPAVLAVNADASHQLPEIVVLDARNGAPRSRSGFNRSRQDQLAPLLAPLESVWTTSPAGKRIHSLLLRPAGFDPARRYPLLVLLHGGPHTQWRDSFVLRWNYHLLAGRDYAVLLTNYSGSTGYGEAYAQSIQGDPFIGPISEINDAADEVLAAHAWIDADRQCAGGASYGGHLANWLQGSTTRYRCLISHAGLVNLESQWGSSDIVYSREANMGGPLWDRSVDWDTHNPIQQAARFATPTLVTIGEQDFRVPLNNSLEYWSALQRQRIESRLVVFPDENHWILKGENSRYFYQEIQQWLQRWLQPEGET